MKCGAQMAMAAAGGYALGRSRKMKWALLLGGIAAGRTLGSSPSEILEQGTKALKSSPDLSKLSGDLSGRLLDAGKAAAVRAASSQMESLTDRLNEQAESLRRASEPSHAEAPEGEQGEQEERGEGGEPEEPPPAEEQPSADESSPAPTSRRRRSATATKSREASEGQEQPSSPPSRTRTASGNQTRQSSDTRQAPRGQQRRSSKSTGTSKPTDSSNRPRKGDSDG